MAVSIRASLPAAHRELPGPLLLRLDARASLADAVALAVRVLGTSGNRFGGCRGWNHSRRRPAVGRRPARSENATRIYVARDAQRVVVLDLLAASGVAVSGRGRETADQGKRARKDG